jgi:hypothetical protein
MGNRSKSGERVEWRMRGYLFIYFFEKEEREEARFRKLRFCHHWSASCRGPEVNGSLIIAFLLFALSQLVIATIGDTSMAP